MPRLTVLCLSLLLSACQAAGAQSQATRHVLDTAEAAAATEAVPAASVASPAADADLVTSTRADRTESALTIYSGAIALVRDVRRVVLPAGAARLRFEDVPDRLDASSFGLFALGASSGTGAFTVRDARFDRNLITPAKLLAAYVGKTVRIRMPAENGQPAREVEAKLLSANDGYVYEIDGRIHLQPPGEVILPDLPAGYSARPALAWRLDVSKPGPTELEARYFAEGLSWQATYTLNTAPDAEEGDWSASAALKNESGQGYDPARVTLVAGDLDRNAPTPAPMSARFDAAVGAGVTPGTLGEAHTYSLDQPIAVNDQETRQVPLFASRTVRFTRRYVFDGNGATDQESAVQAQAELKNTAQAGLGLALPAGVVQVYERDRQGALQLVGRATIGHTPVGAPLTLTLARAFDVTGRRVLRESRQNPDKSRLERWAVTLRNAKDHAVTVRVVEHPYGDWRVENATAPSTRVSANELRFEVPVGAHAATTLTFDLRYAAPPT